jgi:hypothetical protein
MENYCIVFKDYLLFQYNYVIIIVFINKFLQSNVYNSAFISLPMWQEFYLFNSLIFFHNILLRIINEFQGFNIIRGLISFKYISD